MATSIFASSQPSSSTPQCSQLTIIEQFCYVRSHTLHTETKVEHLDFQDEELYGLFMSLKKPPELIKISKIVPSSEGHYMVEFAFSPCAFKVLSPCTWLLSSKKFMLCVSPAVDWCPIQGVPCLPPYDDWQRHQPPTDLKK